MDEKTIEEMAKRLAAELGLDPDNVQVHAINMEGGVPEDIKERVEDARQRILSRNPELKSKLLTLERDLNESLATMARELYHKTNDTILKLVEKEPILMIALDRRHKVLSKAFGHMFGLMTAVLAHDSELPVVNINSMIQEEQISIALEAYKVMGEDPK